MDGILRRVFVDDIVAEAFGRAFRRERVLHDHSNPLEDFDDLQLYQRFRFDRQGIIALTAMLAPALDNRTTRGRPIPPVMKVPIVLITNDLCWPSLMSLDFTGAAIL